MYSLTLYLELLIFYRGFNIPIALIFVHRSATTSNDWISNGKTKLQLCLPKHLFVKILKLKPTNGEPSTSKTTVLHYL
jgi:hypothetical protein